jgi:hypothetical protein
MQDHAELCWIIVEAVVESPSTLAESCIYCHNPQPYIAPSRFSHLSPRKARIIVNWPSFAPSPLQTAPYDNMIELTKPVGFA